MALYAAFEAIVTRPSIHSLFHIIANCFCDGLTFDFVVTPEYWKISSQHS